MASPNSIIEVLLFDPRKKRGKYTKWSVTWIGPFRVQKRLNSCNYVLRKSAKSRPFVVHVDRMRPYLHELDDSDAKQPPLSNASDMQSKLPISPSQTLDANIPSQSAIAAPSVKASATAKPAAPSCVNRHRPSSSDGRDYRAASRGDR